MSTSKITQALWFHTKDGKMKHVTDYYSKIFENHFIADKTTPLGETPSGYAEMCSVKLFGNSYLLMTTSNEHHPFNDSFAIMIHCEGQVEIDKFWNYFTEEGNESMCGWCIDKFGLRWQVIPENMGELMSKPNSWKVMMNQRKIVIQEYL